MAGMADDESPPDFSFSAEISWRLSKAHSEDQLAALGDAVWADPRDDPCIYISDVDSGVLVVSIGPNADDIDQAGVTCHACCQQGRTLILGD